MALANLEVPPRQVAAADMGTEEFMDVKLAQLTAFVNSPANFSSAYNDHMNRRTLLRTLIDDRYHANVAEFARAIKKAPAQVHQWLSGNRALGNAGARDIEIMLNLGQGFFDHGKAQSISRAAIAEDHPGYTAKNAPQADPTLPALLEALAARMAQADPSLRHELALLVVRYLENPQAGARIAAAVELLLDGHIPKEPASNDHTPSA